MSNKKNENANVKNIIENTFAHLKDIVDANTVVGSTIEMGKDLFIIPISKISVGLISGGGSNPKSKKNEYSAGSGTGFNVVPIGFVSISKGAISFLPVAGDGLEKNLIELLLSLVGKINLDRDGENEKV